VGALSNRCGVVALDGHNETDANQRGIQQRHLEKGMIEYTAAGGGKVSRCSVLGSLHK
jgi:hypothetical protein